MIDPKKLRQATSDVADNLSRRGFDFDAANYLALEELRKKSQIDTESLRAERNANAKNVGKAKSRGEDVEPLLAAVKDLGDRMAEAKSSLSTLQGRLREIELGLPNLLDDKVPDGKDESDNRELRRWGDIPEFDFDVKDHVDIGVELGMRHEFLR